MNMLALVLALAAFQPEDDGATVIGRVVNEQGDTMNVAWSVEAIARDGDPSLPRIFTAVDMSVGEFRFEDLPAGEYILAARSRGGHRSAALQITAEAGIEQVVELEYTGPDPARCLVLVVQARLLEGSAPVLLEVTDAEGAVVSQRFSLDRRRGSSQFTDLGPGPYQVSMTDPRFEPRLLKDVPGDSVKAIALLGAGTMVLDVVDGEGHPLAWHRLAVLQEERSNGIDAPGRPVALDRLMMVHDDREIASLGGPGATGARVWPEGVVLRGLLPGISTLALHRKGHVPVIFEGPELIAGKVVTHRLVLDSGHSLAITLRSVQGMPVVGRPVQLTRGKVPARSPDLQLLTDEDGRVTFRGLAAGTYTLRVRFDERWALVDRVVVLPGRSEITISAPPRGWLVPEVLLPDRDDLEGFVRAELQLYSRRQWLNGPRESLNIPLRDSSLEPISLPAGAYSLWAFFKPLDGRGGQGFHLGQVTVATAQPTNHILDLRGSYPALVDLDIQVDGAPMSKFLLEHTAADTATLSGPHQFAQIIRIGNGRPKLMIPPGSYNLSFASKEDHWVASTEFVVTPEEGQVLRLHVPRVPRRLRVLDAETGAPVPRVVCALTEGDVVVSQELIDQPADGWPVNYTPGLLLIDAKSYGTFELPWTRDLPAEVVVRLTP